LRMIGLICANKKDLQKDNGKDPYYSIWTDEKVYCRVIGSKTSNK
jgi:hypothetical protein